MTRKPLAGFKAYALSKDNAQRRMSLLCGTVPPELGAVKRVKHVTDVITLLDQFRDCAGYAKNRRGTSIFELTSEERVQDMLYFMLRPTIPDLVSEQPISGRTRQYSIQDFRSKDLRLVVEAKLVRDKAHGRSIKAEMYDDIGEYKNDPSCDDLIFFVYDPNTYIESPAGLLKSVEGTHSHDGRVLRVHCLVRG